MTPHDDTVDRGVVKRLENGRAFVQIDEQAACEHCGAKILCAPGKSSDRGLLARNAVGAEVGDMVNVTESGHLLLKISTMQFGLPLLGFLLGIFILYGLNIQVYGIPPEIWMFVGGLAGLGIASVISRGWAQHIADDPRDSFEISQIVKKGYTHE